MQIGRIVILAAVSGLALSSCTKHVAETKAQAPDSASFFVEPQWVEAAVNSRGEKIFVEKNSIFPYKDMKMAEIAFQDGAKYNEFTWAFSCEHRLFSNLGEDGSVSDPAPVPSYTVHADLFNYICFGRGTPRVPKPEITADLPMNPSQPANGQS